MGGENEKKKGGMVKKYCSTKLEKTNIGGQDRNENRNLRDIFLCCVFFNHVNVLPTENGSIFK